MAGVVYVLLILAMVGHSSATWCVCKQGSDAVLQKTLDYACGAGADCNPIHQNGPCFNPNTVREHCSYAVNSYFQKKGQAAGSCDFSGTASVVTSDPSTTGCSYPASASATPATTSPTTGTPTTRTPTTGMPSTTTAGGNPIVTTPSSGVLGGGVNNGLGPSGVGINTDESDGGILQQKMISIVSSFFTLVLSGLVFWWA